MIETRMTMSDGVDVAVRTTTPPDGVPVRGVVHVLHGMADHAARYDEAAERLASEGFLTVAHDHRGHGATSPQSFGHIADHDGWQALIDDTLHVGAAVRAEYPDVPYVLLGQSMGSVLVRTLVLDHSDSVDGIVLLGTVEHPGVVRQIAAKALAAGLTAALGGRTPSPLLDRMSFGSFNRRFEGRTKFDWLSRDTEVVDRYVEDPRCGFVCSHRFFTDLLDGVGQAFDRRRLAGVRSDLPVYIASGDQDPVSGFGSAVSHVAALYRRAGLRDVTTRLYPGARHELLGETIRHEVLDDLLVWLVDRVEGPMSGARVIPLRRKDDR